MVGMPSLPAASASYGVSPRATASSGPAPAFLRAASNISGSGLDFLASELVAFPVYQILHSN